MACRPTICPFTVQAALKRRSEIPVKIRLQASLLFHAQKQK